MALWHGLMGLVGFALHLTLPCQTTLLLLTQEIEGSQGPGKILWKILDGCCIDIRLGACYTEIIRRGKQKPKEKAISLAISFLPVRTH